MTVSCEMSQNAAVVTFWVRASSPYRVSCTRYLQSWRERLKLAVAWVVALGLLVLVMPVVVPLMVTVAKSIAITMTPSSLGVANSGPCNFASEFQLVFPTLVHLFLIVFIGVFARLSGCDRFCYLPSVCYCDLWIPIGKYSVLRYFAILWSYLYYK